MQKIIEGIASLPGVLKETGCRKLFLVTDSSYPFLSIRETVEALDLSGKVQFSDFTPNPLFEQVCKGIGLFKSSGCDAILAVGGGSAIDVAKCIKLAVLAEEGENALIPPLVLQRLPIDGARIPFIAVPTTAGTGSESTHNAVMYYEGAKQTVTNDGVLPDYAILEPSVLQTLPLYQKKCTMMDALCQGIESWWSVNSTEESKGYSRKAVESIMQNWRGYIFGNDPETARRIMVAANDGGRAINIAQTTAAHAMSYKITSLYKLPHGHAVAVCLPEIWEYMLEHPEKCVDLRGEGYLGGVFGEIACAMGAAAPEEAIRKFREMMTLMDLRNPVSESGSRSGELDILSRSVNPIRLKNNPVALDEGTIYSLYDSIIRSKEVPDPLISVIVPVFNVGNYVESCLRSILEQSFQNLEILVIDDGSADGTGEICDRLASEDPRLQVIHKENEGVSVARSLGIELSRGEFIGFVDGDDLIHPHYYEILLGLLTPDVDIAVCHIDGVNEKISKCKWEDMVDSGVVLEEDDLLPRLVDDFDFVSVANKLYRRSCIGETRFEKVRPEDADFNYRIFTKGVRVRYSAFGGYACRLRHDSAMRNHAAEYAFMSRLSHCRMYFRYHRDRTSEKSRADALIRIFSKIIRTRWDYYDTEYRDKAKQTADEMRTMILSEFNGNGRISPAKRISYSLLFKSRPLYNIMMGIRTKLKSIA